MLEGPRAEQQTERLPCMRIRFVVATLRSSRDKTGHRCEANLERTRDPGLQR